MVAPVIVCQTKRFSILHTADSCNKTASNKGSRFVVIDVADLLLHEQKGNSKAVRHSLRTGLERDGFCFLTSPYKSGRVSRLLNELRTSLNTELFPDSSVVDGKRNVAGLETSENVYVSEKGVPMYRLGYELCEDRVREVFRVAAGSPDDQRWPPSDVRETWLRCLGLMRHITDTALHLLLDDPSQIRDRPYGKSSSWMKDRYAQSKVGSLTDRSGDFSVLYAMHYFNDSNAELPQPGVAVKAHVDPSLLVLEPFLFPYTTGLQVWDRENDCWIDCDGPTSPAFHLWRDHEVCLLFAGKALASQTGMQPTLHRVVTGDVPRRTVIYEQKYEELFPPPILD
jgi:hypothetical protein